MHAPVIQRASTIDLTHTPWRRVTLSVPRDIWCLVDAEHHPWVAQWGWNWSWNSRSPWKHYAKRNIGLERSTIYLHRELMLHLKPPLRLDLVVDHINGQALDCRVENLRWVTQAENRLNKLKRGQAPSLDAIVAELVGGLPQLEEMPF